MFLLYIYLTPYLYSSLQEKGQGRRKTPLIIPKPNMEEVIMQLNNVYANISAARLFVSNTASAIGHKLAFGASKTAEVAVIAGSYAGQRIAEGAAAVKSNVLCASSKIAQVATNAFHRVANWMIAAAVCSKNMAAAGWNIAKTQAIHGLDFAKAHPVGVGLGISAIVLTAVAAVAYDRAARA